MALALTPDAARTGTSPASLRVTTSALIGMRRALARNGPGGAGLLMSGVVAGSVAAVVTALLGLVHFSVPDRWVDLQATLALTWVLGWIIGPIAFRGGEGLRPEYFALLPVPPRRLAAGLLVTSFTGISPAITLVAFASLPVAAVRLGAGPLTVAIVATALAVFLVVLVSKACLAALTASLSSRRGRDLGALFMAIVIAVASGGWSLAVLMGQQVSRGPAPALDTLLRALPTGWAPVAVAAADRSDWALAVVAMLGLVALSGLLLLIWASLLRHNMQRSGSRSPQPSDRRRRNRAWLGSGPTATVVRKEMSSWRRDPGRSLGLVLALLVSVLNIAVPALAFRTPGSHSGGALGALAWVGPSTALIAGMAAANLYGNDGTAFWLTRVMPGTERADVRGRQLAWLLVVAPTTVALTVGLTAAGGQTWAWPFVLSVLPALLGAEAGLMVVFSVVMAVREKDQQFRTGPFDVGDDPNARAAVAAQGWATGVSSVLAALPGCALVLLGAVRHDAILQAVGVATGVGVGVAAFWIGGNVASRRLVSRGAELMDLFRS